MLVEELESRLAPAVFVVNDPGIAFDFDLTDGVADTDQATPGVQTTLRAAQQNANLTPGPHLITFNLPPGTPVRVSSSGLTFTTQVTIDGGASKVELVPDFPGSVGILTFSGDGSEIRNLVTHDVALVIAGTESTVEGVFMGTDPTGMTIQGGDRIFRVSGDNNTIGGNTAATRNVIAGQVQINGDSNDFIGNYLGIAADGTTPLPSQVLIDERLEVTGDFNRIGGTAPGEGNVIAAAQGDDGPFTRGDGIQILGETTLVVGNFIGTDASGQAAAGAGNDGFGIRFVGSEFATIGGTTANHRNVIAANGSGGIFVNGQGHTIQGNFIGVAADGTPLGNQGDGLLFDQGTGGSVAISIGGSVPGAGNVISGNAGNGLNVAINFFNNVPLVVQGNRIGTNPDGTAAIPNNLHGIRIATGVHVIGGSEPGEGNLISGNGGDGIFSTAAPIGVQNLIVGNRIGTQADGVSPLPNQGNGVTLDRGEVGGTQPGQGNIIAFNEGIGVFQSFGRALVLGNSIFDNGGLGIDLSVTGEPDGVTEDADLNPVFRAGFPIITSVSAGPGSTTINGTVRHFLGPIPPSVRVEFFGNDDPDLSGFGEGKRFLGFADVPIDANSGFGAFSVTFDVNEPLISATASTSNLTSEFSQIAGGFPKPDLQVKATHERNPANINNPNDNGDYIGNNVFEEDFQEASGLLTQRKVLVLPQTAPHEFDVRIQNDGTVAQSFFLEALEENNPGWTVTYADVANDLPILRQDIVQSRFETEILNPGESQVIRVRMVSTAAVADGDENSVVIKVFLAETGGDIEDVVKVIAKAGLVVNSTGDQADANSGDGVPDVDPNTPGLQTTLRSAIQFANALAGAQRITFAIDSPATVNQINIQTGTLGPIPTIISPLTIDGDSQGEPVILRGQLANTNEHGLHVQGVAATIIGLTIQNFGGHGIFVENSSALIVESTIIGMDEQGVNAVANGLDGVHIRNSTAVVVDNRISGNLRNGIAILDSTDDVLVQGNIIGLNSLNNAVGNKENGILVENSQGVTIGGVDGNVIAGNGRVEPPPVGGPPLPIIIGDGIHITGPNAKNNRVVNNRIGTNDADASNLGNFGNGVHISGGASENSIGEEGVGSGNVISGNGLNGVFIEGPNTTLNVVLNNRIGTNSNGDARLGNGLNGVHIGNGASTNQVGSANQEGRNIISANNLHGVLIDGSGTTLNGVLNNFIGLNAAGDAALGNLGDGVHIDDAPSNFLGGIAGFTQRAANVISANGSTEEVNGETVQRGDGVHITGPGATGIIVIGNLLGTDASGNQALGNLRSGVRISGGATRTDIGGGTDTAGTGSGNLISGNQEHGIAIEGSDTIDNRVFGNAIGTKANGMEKLGNSRSGVFIDGANENFVGFHRQESESLTERAKQGNIISGNLEAGITITNGATSNQVRGNVIGLNASLDAKLGNGGDGIAIAGAAEKNDIGILLLGLGPDGNLIGGNDGAGIRISADNNSVVANRIGIVEAFGTTDLGNAQEGIVLEDGATGNTLGLEASDSGNLIAGNAGHGVRISAANNNTLANNTIGGLRNGIPTQVNGVDISNGSNNSVIRNHIHENGGDGIAIRSDTDELSEANEVVNNEIAFSLGHGLFLNGENTTRTVVEKNFIRDNTLAGVHIDDAAGNYIGTRLTANVSGGNEILRNQNGVVVDGPTAKANAILGNRIEDSLPIDLVGPNDLANGSTPNDDDSQDVNFGNNLQNRPNLIRAEFITRNDGTRVIAVEGVLDSRPQSEFLLQFFTTVGVFEGTFGFIGAARITLPTGSNGNFTVFLETPLIVPLQTRITATASRFITTNSQVFLETSEVSPIQAILQQGQDNDNDGLPDGFVTDPSVVQQLPGNVAQLIRA